MTAERREVVQPIKSRRSRHRTSDQLAWPSGDSAPAAARHRKGVLIDAGTHYRHSAERSGVETAGARVISGSNVGGQKSTQPPQQRQIRITDVAGARIAIRQSQRARQVLRRPLATRPHQCVGARNRTGVRKRWSTPHQESPATVRCRPLQPSPRNQFRRRRYQAKADSAILGASAAWGPSRQALAPPSSAGLASDSSVGWPPRWPSPAQPGVLDWPPGHRLLPDQFDRPSDVVACDASIYDDTGVATIAVGEERSISARSKVYHITCRGAS